MHLDFDKRWVHRCVGLPEVESRAGLKSSQDLVGGVDGVVDIFRAMGARKEERFKLTAWHIDAAFDKPPEVLCKKLAIGSIGGGPIDHGRFVEEQRHHASHALHL